MFGIGIGELIVIALVALVLVGPKKLPDLMKQAGKFFVQMRRTANDVKSTFDDFVKEAENELRQEEIEQLKVTLGKQNQELKSIEAGVFPSDGHHDLNGSHHVEHLDGHHVGPHHHDEAHREAAHHPLASSDSLMSTQPHGAVAFDPSEIVTSEDSNRAASSRGLEIPGGGFPKKEQEPV